MTPPGHKDYAERVAQLETRVDSMAGFERVLALLDLAEAHSTRTPVSAIPHIERALKLLDDTGEQPLQDLERNPGSTCRARARAASLLQLAGNNERAQQEARLTLDAQPAADAYSRALALRTLGILLYQREETRKAMELFDEALELARTEPGRDAYRLHTRLIIDRGRGCYRLGETERAEEAVLDGLRRARADDDRQSQATCEVNLGNIRWQLGDLEGALEHYRGAMKIQRELGSLQSLAISLHNLACVHYETDDNDSTLEAISDALVARDELVGSPVLPRLLLLEGRALMAKNMLSEAATSMRAGMEIYTLQENRPGQAAAATALAEVRAIQGNEEATRNCIDRALAGVGTVLDNLSRSRCYVGLARAELDLGQPRRALEHLAGVNVTGTDTRSRRLRADFELCASQAHKHLGEAREALEHFKEGLALERELLVEGSRVRADRLKMLHRLEQGRHREELLADSKVELERRVAERTDELASKRTELMESVESHAALEAQLRHTQKMEAIGRLAGGVAHDFNNLLVVIQGYGERLLRSTRPSELGWEEATQILGAATRASRLTSQLLAFSRRDAYREQICELGELAAGMEHMLRRLIGEDVQFVVELPDEPTPMLGDPGRVEQMILDLVVHARDEMPGGGRLELRVDEQPAGTLRLSLWHEALSGATSTDEVDESSGLDDARAIVEHSGGSLAIEPAPGGGTRIVVSLPRHGDTPDQPAASESKPSSGAGRDRRILLVDDENGVRELVAGNLRALSYDVTEANNGRSALRRTEESDAPFDLIVCDVSMPDLDGPGFFEALRKRGRSDPFLFISGYSDEAETFLDQHADEVELLAKPFLLRQLEARIATMLARAEGHT